MSDFTMDELLRDLLKTAAQEQGEGYSTRELARKVGCSHQVVQDYLHDRMEEGRLVVRWRQELRIDGQRAKIPVYSLKE